MSIRMRGWILAAGLAAGASWLWQDRPAPGADLTEAASVSEAGHAMPAAAVPQSATVEPEPRLAGSAAAAPDDTPPGLTRAQWATVLQRLQGQPDALAERRRLAAYFGWADAVQRWRAAPDDGALARQVDAGLPARVAQREVSASEARQLKLALLRTLAPDDAARAAALQAFDAALPVPSPPDPRQPAYAQAQAAAVAAWHARPVDQRDPQALASELAALRHVHFADPIRQETTR